MTLQLTWYQLEQYLPEKAEGVYRIYSVDTINQKYIPIRVGQGVIHDRFTHHLRDPQITRYPNLLFIWAPCHQTYRDGVEKYLADALNPLVGERFPDRYPISVNL